MSHEREPNVVTMAEQGPSGETDEALNELEYAERQLLTDPEALQPTSACFP
jgi:hypothetical protein